MIINNGDKILFTGDSVTDGGRDRNDLYGLAVYSKMVNDYINIFNPEKNIKVFNRGISGNTSKMLDERMEKDLAEIKPDVVSILIGINDVWRRYDSNTITTCEDFVSNYTSVINKIKKYTDKIILLEPFLLTSDSLKAQFREDLDPKINALRTLAIQQAVEYIPLDGIFAELSILNGAKTYSADGVHPAIEGHKIIAAQWIKRTNLFKI